jgi:hypothetical protein
MIRAIIERHAYDFNSGLEERDYTTIDVNIPEIETLLRKGGKGEIGFEKWRFIGVEIIDHPGDVT